MIGSARLGELQAEARYRRERYDLYKAKSYGPRLTSATRLRELERMHEGADARRRAAQTSNRRELEGRLNPEAPVQTP